MKLSCKDNQSQQPGNDSPWCLILSHTGLFLGFLGGSVLLCGLTGINWGLSYTQEKLAPQIAQLLSETLNRPVQLGAIEHISPTGLRLGASMIPATATDRDQVTVEAIDIQVNVLDAVAKGKVGLTVTLIHPQVFVDQDPSGNWLNTELVFEGDDRVEVTQIRLRDATIELAAQPKQLRSLINNPEAQGIPVAPAHTTLQQVDLDFALHDNDQRITFKLAGTPETGGEFQLRGEARLEDEALNLHVKSKQLSVIALNPFLPETIRFDAGQLSSNLDIAIQEETIALKGAAEVENVAAQVEGEPNLFTQASGKFQLQGQQILVEQAQVSYGQIPFEAITGTIDLQHGLDLVSNVQSVSLPAFMQTFELDVPIPASGALTTTELHVTGPLEGAIFSGIVQEAEPIRFDRLPMGKFRGEFSFDTGSDHLVIHQAELTPEVGGSVLAKADIWLGEEERGEPDNVALQLQVQGMSADAIARLYQVAPPIGLGQLSASGSVSILNEVPEVDLNWQLTKGQLPVQGKIALDDGTLQLQQVEVQVGDRVIAAEGELTPERWRFSAQGSDLPLDQIMPEMAGKLSGDLQIAGNSQQPLASATGTLQAIVRLADGTLAAQTQVSQGQWQTTVQTPRLALNQVMPDLVGDMQGEVQFTGDLANLSPEATRATGQVQLSQRGSKVAMLKQPLQAVFNWDGDRLHIQRATAAGFNLAGWVAADFSDWYKPTLTGLNLQIHCQDYDLATLPFSHQLPVQVGGAIDFNGRVTGTPIAPDLNGSLQLQNFSVNQIAFDPALQGQVKFVARQGGSLQLVGEQDQIALVLDQQYRPKMFTLRRGQALIQTVPQSVSNPNRLQTTIENFPLETLALSPNPALGVLSGLLSGQFVADLTQPSNPKVTGEMTIAHPQLGATHTVADPDHANDRFTGKVYYGNETLSLTDGELRLGAGRYRLTGELLQSDQPQMSGQLTTDNGNLQDLVALLSATQWQALLQQLGVGNSIATAQKSSELISEVASLSGESVPNLSIPNLQTLSLPALTQLQGRFATEVKLQSSPTAGLAVDFNLQGQNWTWGEYGIQQVAIANGHFDGAQLILQPLQVQGLTYQSTEQSHEALEALVQFNGQVGNEQSGQLRVEQVPLSVLARFLNLPIPVAGELSAAATLTGQVDRPEVTGHVEMANVRLNQREIRDLRLLFRYLNQQFYVDDWVLVDR
ncbi:MAG: hypothetical protein Kow00121_02530 [Elainellaceae cyanobacterium]